MTDPLNHGPHRRPVASTDPRTGTTWRTWPYPTAAQIHSAVTRATTAQPTWAALPLNQRLAAAQRFRNGCFARRHEIAALIEREVGKSAADALGADVLVTLDLARYFIAIAPRALRTRTETGASLAFLRKAIEIRREPMGVIAVISPWNYPFMLAAGIMLPALIAGNAVILKPSEFSTATAEILVELLRAAGVPDDICQCLPGDAETGAALIAEDVHKVFFTGSMRGGQAVATACGASMIPVNLELGGSDAAIVLNDADVHATARALVWARFFTAGQTCVAPKRIFVEAAIHDALVAAIQSEMTTLQTGVGRDAHIGPLVRTQQVDTLNAQRADAIAHGAIVAAESPALHGNFSDSIAIPTLLTNVSAEARIMHEEAFGPLMAVSRVRDADDAIARANDTPFGLSASIWTRDTHRAALLAPRIHAGTVLINDAVVNVGIPNLPHGGVKASGTGRSHGIEGFLESTHTRTIVRDRIPWMPQPWWFTRTADHTAFFDAVARAGHAPTWLTRARAAIDAVRFWPRRNK